MKIFTTKLLGLVISALLLGACSQMATYENEDLTNTLAKSDQSGFKLSPYGSEGFNRAMLADCSDGCISDRVLLNENKSVDIGRSGKTKDVNFQIWNTPEQMLIQLKSNVATDKVLYTINSTEFTYDPAVDIPADTYFIIYFDLPEGYEACEYILESVRIDGGGPQLEYIDINYGVYEYCSDCDEESFTYDATVGETEVDVLFSYSYSEEAEVSIDFTFPQINIDIPNQGTYVGADGKSYVVTGNGTVFHWTGSVSCSSEEPTTFAFEGLMPDCGPSTAKDGLANIWTNAKVLAINGVELVDDLETLDVDEGPYSLKGDLESIVYSGCPTKD